MRTKSFLLIVIISIALSGHLVDGNSITINQERPSFRYQQNNHVSSGQVFFGNNTDSQFEMLSSKFTTINSKVTLTGNPTVEVINPFQLNVSGSFNKNVNISSRVVGTYFEVNDYLEEYNELERYRITDNQVYTESDKNFETQFNFIQLGYSIFDNNASYNKIEDQRSGITAFILRTGSVDNIRLNNTEGDEIGQLFSFRISVTIFYYTTDTRKLIAIHQSTDFSYGNIIPESIINYLKSTNFIRNLNQGVIGKRLFENYRFSNIEWIDSGFNSTLGLNIYSGLYFYSRITTSAILDPTTIPLTLNLNQFEDEFDEFQNDLLNANLIDAFSDEILNAFENELSENILNEGSVTTSIPITTTSETTSETSNLQNLYDENIFFITQLTALFILTIVLIRWKTNS